MNTLQAAPEIAVEITPSWRGVLHKYACVVAILGGVYLVATAHSVRSMWAGGVFALSLSLLFTVSALYHRVNWDDRARAWMRRADHSSIFILIAGTYTPFALLSMEPSLGNKLLVVSWVGAVLGAAPSLFWAKAPHWLVALLCVTLGWVGVPFWTDPRNAMDTTSRLLIFAGGAFYTLGAIFFARKQPALWPKTFGYHELFHLFTLFAASFHYAAVLLLVRRM